MQNTLVAPDNAVLKHSETIEVVTVLNKGDYTLGQNNENIEKGEVIAIEAYSTAETGLSPINGLQTVNANAFKNAYLTLSVNNQERVSKLPLRSLNPASNGGRMKVFEPMKLNISKCKIEVPAATGVVSDEAFILVFHYR